jgi:Ala-tRNA(Pro) deacylase
MIDICAFLTENGIPFTRFEHPAVFTTEEAAIHVPKMEAYATKNLFLRNKKGDKHYLVVVGDEKQVDLKMLGTAIGAEKLSFASAERLKKYLDVEPGSVTLLGLANDSKGEVEVWIDEAVWNAKSIQCHPLVNTATLAIEHQGIEKFLACTGHAAKTTSIPGKN